MRKAGPIYDLPIAVAILVASGQVPDHWGGAALVGELGLDGSVRHVAGVLPLVAMFAQRGVETAVVPAGDTREAGLLAGITIAGLATLGAVRQPPDRWPQAPPAAAAAAAPGEAPQPPFPGADTPDLAVVRGQEHVKRALEVAAAGGHNVMLQGPPGAGKTLLARALPGLLPPMTRGEALEVVQIYSVAGLLGTVERVEPLLERRPFRHPHHTVSHAGLVGGGQHIRPGEISLAHRGVLFLDEFPEFPGAALEALREPLETGEVTISRVRGSVTFPARVLLIAAMNPCPCGYYGDTRRACTCQEAAVSRYQRRISGPLLDRFDLFVEVPRVAFEDLVGDAEAESSATVRARVGAARSVQVERFDGTARVSNAEMGPQEVRRHCQEALVPDAAPLLEGAMEQLGLSARSFHRVLKVARTIADLDGCGAIARHHLAEAIQYRRRGAE